jgi:enediyne biosynthesis protein E5
MSAPTTINPPASTARDSWARCFFTMQNRFIPPIFITAILLMGHFSFGILESWTKTLLAIGCSIAAELILGRTMTGKWPHLASAYITGISVGILLRSPAFWPYALCAVIAITSKYILRVKNRHIWNPSNFGICVMLFFAAESVTALSIQWGNSLWAMLVIWSLGSVIIWRLKRFHICAVYVVSFLVFALLRAWIVGDPWQSEISPVTGPEYQLFIFFMITDPKTTVRSVRGQCLVAFLVAAVEMVLRLDQSIYAPLYALFLVGPVAMLVETWLNSRRSPLINSNSAAVLAGGPSKL